MKFDLIRPCANCPFRHDQRGYLTQGRVEDLEESLERGTFACHKTVDYAHLEEAREAAEADDEEWEHTSTPGEHHCAGALILLEKEKRPSQMMRIAEHLDLYDRTKLDMEAPVFDTWEDMREAMER